MVARSATALIVAPAMMGADGPVQGPSSSVSHASGGSGGAEVLSGDFAEADYQNLTYCEKTLDISFRKRRPILLYWNPYLYYCKQNHI